MGSARSPVVANGTAAARCCSRRSGGFCQVLEGRVVMPDNPKRSFRSVTLGARADSWLETGDRLVYVLVAGLFLVAALAMAAYSVATFVQDIQGDFPLDLI